MFTFSTFSRRSRVLTAKKSTKKRDSRAKLLFCQSKPISQFFAVVAAVVAAVVVAVAPQNLGRSGNSKIPDRLAFSRHMKTRN